MSGGALGEGIMLVFPAHMNRIVQLDPKSGIVTVEPGLNYGRLQQTLLTHERFLPPFPASLDYSTIGGAVGNNAAGEKSVKYGSTVDYVKSLRVILANGEVIETGRLHKRELSKKLGLSTFEGEVYRAIDTLLEENKDTVLHTRLATTKNTSGYAISSVKHKDGSFDLTPLFVGSQGTLGIISDITLATEPYNPDQTVYLALFDSIDAACEAVLDLRTMPSMPSSIEMVDGHLLDLVSRLNPNLLKNIVTQPLPRIALIVEFDDPADRNHKKTIKKVNALFGRLATSYRSETESTTQAELTKLRDISANLLSYSEKQLKAIPLIDDGIVPVNRLGDLLSGVYTIFGAQKLQVAVWGHAGDGNIHIHPFFDIGQLGDRQRAFRLLDDYTKLLVSLGGSTSAQHNDGRLRGPYLESVYGPEGYALMQRIKQIFDPHGILNPGVKVGVRLDDVKPLLRTSYGYDHLYHHMPRT